MKRPPPLAPPCKGGDFNSPLYKGRHRGVIVNLLIIICFFTFLNSPVRAAELQTSVKADFILVEKAERRLTLFAKDKKIRTYKIALGRKPEGPKLEEGDQRTPEGSYIIDARNPDSKFHLSLHISYPNEIDNELAFMAGLISGGSIMIHGAGEEYEWMGKFHSLRDWTDGCIAVTNDEIEEIWNLVPIGTLIKIMP
jgi:murein L,D-transpeptidase YafK